MMDSKYRPDGWLGFIVGSKFWIDFSEKHRLDSNADKLVKELGNRGKTTVQETTVKGVKCHRHTKHSRCYFEYAKIRNLKFVGDFLDRFKMVCNPLIYEKKLESHLYLNANQTFSHEIFVQNPRPRQKKGAQ